MLPFQHTGLQICRLGVEGYGDQNMYMFMPLLIELFFISDDMVILFNCVNGRKE